MDLSARVLEALWVGGLAATPVAMGVALICRARGWSPATRHMMWLSVLLCFVTPTIVVVAGRPAWFTSERVLDMAASVLGSDAPSVDDAPEGGVSPREGTPRVASTRGSLDAGTRPVMAEPAVALGLPLVARPLVQKTASEPREVMVIDDVAPRSASVPSASMSMDFGGVGATARPEPRAAADDPGIWVPAGVVPSSFTRATAAPAAQPLIAADEPTATRVERGEGWPMVHAAVRAVVRVRDWAATLPPVPIGVWVCGVVVVLVVRVWRTVAIHRAIGPGTPTDVYTLGLVRSVARSLGLRRAPETVMAAGAVSPLILCGLRPRLVLPSELWHRLDDDSRRSILVHELAHLRRRDHVLHWLEWIVGAAYWWHPIAWWARRRMHEEAEASCDAWVTSLLPASRRAYAEALLATRTYLITRERSAGPWIGMMSGRAQRLARRITMVMTQRTTPKTSALGVCVAALLVGVGTLVLPAMACPPEQGSATAERAAESAAAEASRAGARAERAAAAAQRPARAGRAAARAGQSPADMAPPAPGVPGFLGEAPALEAMKPGQPAPDMATPTPPAPPTAPTPRPAPAPRAMGGYAITVPGSIAVATPQAIEVREYRLPAGKLRALTALMSRDDVPIYVSNAGDRISVQATPAQHEVFGAFVALIHPEKLAEARTAEGQRSMASMERSLRALERQREQLAIRAEQLKRQRDQSEAQRERAKRQLEELRSKSRSMQGDGADQPRMEAEATRLAAIAQASGEMSQALAEGLNELQTSLSSVREQVEAMKSELAAMRSSSGQGEDLAALSADDQQAAGDESDEDCAGAEDHDAESQPEPNTDQK